MKNLYEFFLTVFFTSVFIPSIAQVSQTLRGTVTDADSKIPLIGVNISVIKDSTTTNGAVTDEDGNYRVENIPVGRFKMKFSYIGYQQQTIDNVIMTSGKEVVLNISLN